MAIDSYRFCRNIFQFLSRKLFRVRIPMMVPSLDIKWTLSSSSNAFTRPTHRPGVFVINIGLSFPSVVLGYGPYFPDQATAIKYKKGISWCYQGLVYHEIGHLLFTDMVSNDIWDYKDKDLVFFISSLANIVEDFVIENYGMGRKFPFTKKYFAFLVKTTFDPSVPSYSDHGDMQSFLSYLLLKLRCGKLLKSNGKTNGVWDANEAQLKPLLLACINEADAHQRMLNCIKMAEWLVANVTSVNWKSPQPDPSSVSGVGSMGSSVTGSGVPGGLASNPTSPRRKASGTAGSNGNQAVGQSSSGSGSSNISNDDNVGKDKGEFDPASAGDLDSTNDGEYADDYDPNYDIPIEDLQDVNESMSSILGGDDEHVWIDAKSYYIPNDFVKDEINNLITSESDVSNGIRIAFNKFTAHIKPRFNGGFHSGRLDTRAVIRQQVGGIPDTRLFMRRVPRGLAPDVAFSILCDNSGSMSGNKSYVTTRAMIAFAKACDMCRLPCEINLFVDGSVNATITLKDFDDSFESSKQFFGIAHSNLVNNYTFDSYNIPSFSGNIDEVNLFHVWNRFKKNPHKDKVLIVISDGMTCGSTQDLSNLVKKIESEGCYVIGIGIQSKAVLKVYPHVKIFDSAESLDDLPAFMSNMVMNIMTGKE